MATALDIANGEARELIESGKELARFKSQKTVTKTHSGVIVSYKNDGKDGRKSIKMVAVERALAAIARRGVALPAQINVLCSSADGVRCVAFMSTTLVPDIYLGPKIAQLNPNQPHVPTQIVGGLGGKTSGARGIASQVYDAQKGSFLGIGDPKLKAQAMAIVVHEMGHYLHSLSDPNTFWDGKAGDPLLASNWDTVSSGVSQYAMQSALEFVAEVFTGTVALGRQYSGAIQTAYTALGGPGATTGGFWV